MFKFSDYTLRLATEQDRASCERWIASDADHRGKVTADFFLKQEPGVQALVLEDKFGEPVFFFKMTCALRLDIQFGPSETLDERERTREALTHGFGWLKELCQQAGIRQIIFESKTARLIQFCEKRFGFDKSPDELVCGIAPQEAKTDQEKDVQQ